MFFVLHFFNLEVKMRTIETFLLFVVVHLYPVERNKKMLFIQIDFNKLSINLPSL